jgi:LAO/AO transport system kinase
MTRHPGDVATLADAVRAGSRAHLAQAITLVESRRVDDRSRARELLAALRDHSPQTCRIGVSGIPGVGKSSFIETLGRHLIDRGHRVGVLAIDPSSVRTGGSVLGDKTRMPSLAVDSRAFVRPSPTAGTLGGVARTTAQTMTLVEAAGFDVVIVETVGIGQSEFAVASMVDTFLLLALARSGDQLQGIKKGVLEVADIVAVNKADGEHVVEARSAARDLRQALHVVGQPEGAWRPVVTTCSALTGAGVEEVWQAVQAHREFHGAAEIRRRRAVQQWSFVHTLVADELTDRLRRSAAVSETQEAVRAEVLDGRLSAGEAADLLLAAFDSDSAHSREKRTGR